MTFQVSACNDAHVILMTGNTESEKHYFIAFGGWGNTMSIIEDESVAKYDGVVLNCTEYKEFWINWDSCMINVGHGTTNNEHIFLSLASASICLDIVNIGVRTAHGAKGKWIFYHEGGYYTLLSFSVIYKLLWP